MQCPKCHTKIEEKQTVCHKCHKVLLLECPNCHELGDSAVCTNCGYTILVKCSKCSKINNVKDVNCTKCGFPVASSLAYQECESDEYASVSINFNNLNKIRKILGKKGLYEKFYYRLKNLLLVHMKDLEGKVISYGDEYEINFNKELSFATSSNKAVRFSLKLINAFTGVNNNILGEFGTPLNMVVTITRKTAEELQNQKIYENNVKPLSIKKTDKKYLKGLQVVLDEYVRDEVSKEFKTDSLYTVEESGKTITFYEIILDSYVLPPSKTEEKEIDAAKRVIINNKNSEPVKDYNNFRVLDLNAKCKFEITNPVQLLDKLRSMDLAKQGKIITLRSEPENRAAIEDITETFSNMDYKVVSVTCTPNMNYKPWGFFEELFKDYFGLNEYGVDNIDKADAKFAAITDLLKGKSVKAMTPEDARYNYIEKWNRFLGTLSRTVIIADGFENIDDTSIQTLVLYFDKYRNIVPNFVFMVNKKVSVHSKIKSLIRTDKYTELTLGKSSIEECLSTLKSDASDFINSFYFEKIKENYNGSYLYFKNAVNYLKDTEVIIDFENKLIVNSQKSVIIPTSLETLYRARLKYLSSDSESSFIIAYAGFLSARLDRCMLTQLGIKDPKACVDKLVNIGFARTSDGILYINNYVMLSEVALLSVKKQAEEFLVKNIIAKLGNSLDDSAMAFLFGRLGMYKEEYLTLWKNSQFALKTGDYDSYLKNCLSYLSLVEHLGTQIDKSAIEENKKDVYNNILMFLYGYSPAKIYFIENILLMDAIEEGDDEKIVKLSNLMLQGALISSNYTDALGLLHNILSRMKNPTLTVDGELNAKFLLLSLVNVEILYNIGNFRQCSEVADELLKVLNKNNIEKVKPESFSTNLFVSHIMDTFRLAGFAKLFLMDDNLDEFFEKVHKAMESELPEKDCILAVKEFLAGKTYTTDNIEGYSPYSKVIFLILQEISNLKSDYKRFAQNIYQAKLLASDINQKELELFCDALIGYAYSKVNIEEKAESIYEDILKTAERDAIFNILAIAKYFLAKLYADMGRNKESMRLIKDTLMLIREYDNQAAIMYILCKKLQTDIMEHGESSEPELEAEKRCFKPYAESLKLILE